MPRKGPSEIRKLSPDPVYQSELVAQVINKVLRQGKRTVAETIVYRALGIVAEKVGGDPVVVLNRALDNVRPETEVRSRRVGGATYQVPVVVKTRRSSSLAIRWIVSNARKRREKTMIERLANEILDASNGVGASVKRRDDTHKMAESNRAFMHYRW
jgi:small subunit ribosomal protein S7